MEEIARDVAVIPMAIVNAYLVGTSRKWILVDCGTPGNGKKIQEAAAARFGSNATPEAIVLTHGHLDHSGSAAELGAHWKVKVYAHRREWPFLTGKSLYPPTDATAPGFFAAISRFFPRTTANVEDRIAELNGSLESLGFPGWQVFETPGHTPGHISLFRAEDGVLLAGDALVTVNMDNFFALVLKKPQVCRPPVPATTDWPQARRSVQLLAALRPRVIGAGHGTPMLEAAEELSELANHFPIPRHGQYVNEPARFDDAGLAYVPPAPPDHAPKIAAGVAVGLAIAVAGALLLKKKAWPSANSGAYLVEGAVNERMRFWKRGWF